jgi:hypothetical protein
MKQKVWKTFVDSRDFILSIRVTHADRLCHKVLEMDPEIFLCEAFFSFYGLYSIGANLHDALPKRLVRELNNLNWDYEDDLDLPGLPSEVPQNIEVLDENTDEDD